jgi:hypothetical protein
MTRRRQRRYGQGRVTLPGMQSAGCGLLLISMPM